MSPPRRSFGGSYSAEFEVRREAALEAIWRRRRDMFDLILFVDSTTASRSKATVVATSAAIPVAAPEPVNLDLLKGEKIPEGWMCREQQNPLPHTIALSDERSPSGGRTVRIARHSAPWEWGDGLLVQKFAAGRWRGRRLRFRASIRALAEGLGTGAQLFICVSPKSANGSPDLAITADRPVRSAQWGRYAVEVDVPIEADVIEIGLLASGNGSAWFGDLELEMA